MKPLEPHPLAALIRTMTDAEFSDLRSDIERHGQHEPIAVYQGKILDGRNRWRACIELKRKPKTKLFTGTPIQARAYVLSQNLHRRHLSFEERRAVVAAELQHDPARSDQMIANLMAVDRRTIAKMRAELVHIPELKRRGLDGKLHPARNPAPGQGESKRRQRKAATPKLTDGEYNALRREYVNHLIAGGMPSVRRIAGKLFGTDELILYRDEFNAVIGVYIERARHPRTTAPPTLTTVEAPHASDNPNGQRNSAGKEGAAAEGSAPAHLG